MVPVRWCGYSCAMVTPGLIRLLAVTAGVAVANIYYAQPMVGLIAASFGLPGTSGVQCVTAAQVGYATGIVLLVPLGDRVDRRRLIIGQVVLLTVALIAAAAAPSLAALSVASVLVGIASTVAQQAVPFAAELAGERERGRVVGQVMSGLLAGILLARTLSGVVGDRLGWRPMFVLGAAMALGLLGWLWRALPHSRPSERSSYGALMYSLLAVSRRYKAVRRAAVVQGLLFGGFSAFWSILALRLAEPPYRLGAEAAGLYGVIGLVGVLVAPIAGRMADRRGAWLVGLVGVLLVLPGWAALAVIPGLIGIGISVVLLDAGIQATLISNQAAIFGLDPAVRSRLNTVFVTGIFVGGALGSSGGGLAWATAGWPGVILFGGCLTGLALLAHLLGR
jgi:predicted MFS family arabinose efflux permease